MDIFQPAANLSGPFVCETEIDCGELGYHDATAFFEYDKLSGSVCLLKVAVRVVDINDDSRGFVLGADQLTRSLTEDIVAHCFEVMGGERDNDRQ